MRKFAISLAAVAALAADPAVAANPEDDVLAAASAAAEEAGAAVDAVIAAVAATDRPEDARAMDESRKPVDVLTWMDVRPGMTVADLLTGTGYWAEILGHVVGPEGHVVALEPNQFYNDEKSGEAWKALVARAPAVSLERYPFEAFTYAPDSFDAALINLSYHDLYWQSEQYKIPRTDPDAFVRNLFAAMKPGGVVGVIDHVGNPGDTRDTVDKLHRIDPAVVKADFERAGFELVDESDLLANPEDDHTKLVFDPAIRGKTDRFVMKFAKPAE
jgi:predicted methyltransferase